MSLGLYSEGLIKLGIINWKAHQSLIPVNYTICHSMPRHHNSNRPLKYRSFLLEHYDLGTILRLTANNAPKRGKTTNSQRLFLKSVLAYTACTGILKVLHERQVTASETFVIHNNNSFLFSSKRRSLNAGIRKPSLFRVLRVRKEMSALVVKTTKRVCVKPVINCNTVL